MNRKSSIIGLGVAAFAIIALVGGLVWGANVVAAAIFCGLGVAIVFAVAEVLARPERERQLEALEQLALHGRALPEAADALSLAVARLGELEEVLRGGHAEIVNETLTAVRETAEHTQLAVREGAELTQQAVRDGAGESATAIGTAAAEAQRTFERISDAGRTAMVEDRKQTVRILRDTAMQIREDMKNGVAEATKASTEAVAPVAAEAMKTATNAATLHLASIRTAVEEDASERRRVQAAAVESLDAHLKAIETRLDEQLNHRADADAKVLIALEAHARNIREAEDERVVQLSERWETMSEAQENRVTELAARVERMSETVGAALTETGRAHEQRVTELAARVEQMSEAASAALTESAKHDAERGERLSEMATQIQADLGTATTIVRERLEAGALSDAQNEKRAAALLDQVAKASSVMAEATSQQSAALETFATAADERVAEAEQRGAERIADLAVRFEAAAEAQQKRLAVFEAELSDRQRTGAETLASQLADHAKGVDATLRETAELVREAAGLVHAGGTEMTAVAEMFAGAVDKQREAANTWIESLGKIDAAVVDAGEHAAVDVLGDYLARTHELFDQQLGFQQELFEQLTVGAQGEGASANA